MSHFLTFKHTTLALSIMLFSLSAISEDANTSTTQTAVPKIQDIPRLRAGLPAGTIAWATSEQLHPTQPQTGKREVARKTEMFKSMLNDGGKSFSKQMYEFAYQGSVSPVFIAKTPKSDSRYGQEEVLGYITDRTHGSDAQSEMIQQVYGKKALKKPLLDDKARPLNFILVKVMGDMTETPEDEFHQFMIENKHCYLKNWERGKHGRTEINDISFTDLPERVTETTDNPYRGLIGELQHDKLLGRSPTDFSQFIDAEALVKYDVVEWDEISLEAGKKDYKKAIDKASKFFKSKEAVGLPGATVEAVTGSSMKCEQVFKN